MSDDGNRPLVGPGPPTAWGRGGFSISAEEAKRLTGSSLGSPTSTAARQSFAYMFTVALLCLYSGPCVLALQLGRDHDAAYFIGRWGLVAVAVPIYILFMHLVILGQFATEERKCKKSIFVWTAVLPAILLALAGGIYMTDGRYWEGQLLSEECSSYGAVEKPHLQKAYVEALEMYQECEKRMIEENGGKMPMWRPTLQACQEWARLAPVSEQEPWKGYQEKASKTSINWEKEFTYLASVEANHVCGGFCTPGPMLWSDYDIVGRQGGKCSPMVGNKMHVVAREGLVLLVVSLVGISCFFFLWAAADEKLKPFFYAE